MTKEKAQQVLTVFCNGELLRPDILREAIRAEVLPELKKNIDFDNIRTKTTYYIATFEPDQEKQWISLDELRRVLQSGETK